MNSDVIVLGSGAAGLVTALAAADAGANVLLLERSALFGGTTAISGGQVWLPNNGLMHAAHRSDSAASAGRYLEQLTLGQVAKPLLNAFVDTAPQLLEFLDTRTRLRFFMVERPDYHSEWEGAGYGRSIEPMPFDAGLLGVNLPKLRRSPYRPPLTSAELKRGEGKALTDDRLKGNAVTQGAALVAGLLAACVERGVQFRSSTRARSLVQRDDAVVGVRCRGEESEEDTEFLAPSVVVASGGFEWNEQLKAAYLTVPDEGAATPPWNEGDGLLMCLRAGASVACMTESWWSAAVRVPGERYDGHPLVRNIVRELALPGSILVNDSGHRFVNEASSYNDLGKAFHAFDPGRNKHVNRRAWLVFDRRFKLAYPVATIPAAASAPAWFESGETVADLASRCGINASGLARTVSRFNDFARRGLDEDFGRGSARHDRHHGDATQSHPNLGLLETAPYYAVPIFLGNLGTKGGMRTDQGGCVLNHEGRTIDGLFACGNAAASWMGPGYPGAGGSLGPIMTAALLCGRSAAARAADAPTKT